MRSGYPDAYGWARHIVYTGISAPDLREKSSIVYTFSASMGYGLSRKLTQLSRAGLGYSLMIPGYDQLGYSLMIPGYGQAADDVWRKL